MAMSNKVLMSFKMVLTTPTSVTCIQTRNMANLKAISMRLKAVKNIQKITKSMKMVSAAKYAKAERELKPARAYGASIEAFYNKADVKQDMKQPNHLIVAMTSDRGLCGSAHSNIVRSIKANLPNRPEGTSVKYIAVGDKAKGIIGRFYGNDVLMHFNNIGKKPPVFQDASLIANEILKLGYKFDFGEIYYNVFRSVVAYETKTMPLVNAENFSHSGNLNIYDSIDEEILRSYREFSLASMIYFTMKESACSEQSQRMTAMDGATKNAGEMIERLTLYYNRSRQAVITNELVEIISGAAALKQS